MLRVAATAALLILGGATVAFARPGLGNSHDPSLRSTQIACGSERREVKQLLDDDAVNVAFGHGIDSTVKRMGQLKRPTETGPTRQKKERRGYRPCDTGRRIRDSNLPANRPLFPLRYAPGSAPYALARDDLARKRAATLSVIDAFASDPFLRFLDDAPVDDEPVTAEEEAAIAEVERDRAAGVPT